MTPIQILRSKIDRSINIVTSHPISNNLIEARSVQRTDDTLIIYLSSFDGCNHSCRFCHLTQTGQTDMTPITDFVSQARDVLKLNREEGRLESIKTIHVNFMARGDILSNEYFRWYPTNVLEELYDLCKAFAPDAEVKFKISTIFPKSVYSGTGIYRSESSSTEQCIDTVLMWSEDKNIDVEFYYSLYSLKPDFRKKWIPKAVDPEVVGQWFTGRDKGLRLHHALINSVNDTEEDVALIHDWLERHDLRVMLNIVRYNPFDSSCGEESDDITIQTYINLMKLSHRVELVQIIPRVGKDVNASCGMFVV